MYAYRAEKQRLAKLYEAFRRINAGGSSLDQLVTIILRAVRNLVNSEHNLLLFVDNSRDQLWTKWTLGTVMDNKVVKTYPLGCWFQTSLLGPHVVSWLCPSCRSHHLVVLITSSLSLSCSHLRYVHLKLSMCSTIRCLRLSGCCTTLVQCCSYAQAGYITHYQKQLIILVRRMTGSALLSPNYGHSCTCTSYTLRHQAPEA